MDFLMCAVPVCPVRADASHRSEQVSQLLFGELCQPLEKTKDFVKIRVVYDNYEGWCQQTQLAETGNQQMPLANSHLAADLINKIIISDQPMYIPFASSIPADGLVGDTQIHFEGAAFDPAENSVSIELIQKLSSTFINTTYQWGGRSVFGIDCSGFTQLVFKCMNIPLLRDASQQATQGDEAGFLQEAKCGDLAFFDNEAAKITHVGILLDAGTIIHASGKVRIDKIDNRGIMNAETGKRTHNLRLIKRMTTRSNYFN